MSGFDAFSGGVLPGGLWTQSDIRILICYLLQSISGSLTEEDITKVIHENGMANYFEVKDAVASLLKHKHIITKEDTTLELTDSGREIARQLDVSLPRSVRDKAVNLAVRLLSQVRSRRENQVDIEETDAGYMVHCKISGGTMNLMTISLYVPDKKQAYHVRERFHADPAGVYEHLLSYLTDVGL